MLQPYRDDPVCEAVERAVRAGIVVVAAAGNIGQTADGRRVLGGIVSPGNSPYAITVGALDTKGTAERADDVVATFSSSGPTRFDLVLKPDLVAPGRRVTSAEAVGSLLSANFPERHVAGSGPNAYIAGVGDEHGGGGGERRGGGAARGAARAAAADDEGGAAADEHVPAGGGADRRPGRGA